MKNCLICGKEIAVEKYKKVCSAGCRYKKNLLLWVLEFMKDHKTLDEKVFNFFSGKLNDR